MTTKPEIEADRDALTLWRRHLHQHPELAFEEHETAAFVADKLRAFGVDEVHEKVGRTGVVGVVHGQGGGEGGAIGLRADMDALPIHEATNLAHASKHAGVMHACGHDGHTAMLLGAAKHLAATRAFKGTVYLVFQPAEEQAGGGRVMVEEGMFERFPMRSVYGLHNWPGMEAGAMALHEGAVMASMDTFEVHITGRGAHAAMPYLGTDPVLIAAQTVVALQGLVSRETRATDALVVSVTQVHAGEADNVIPETAVLSGTVRAFDEAVRSKAERGIERIASGIAAAFGAEARTAYERGYPATVNTAIEAVFAREVAAETVGGERTAWNLAPSMGAEDFAFMLEKAPGAYAWIGSGEDTPPLHSPHYDFNDAILPVGASYWATLAERALPLG